MARLFSEFVTIGDIADVKGGKRLPKGMIVQDEETSHRYLRVVDFNNNGLNRSNVKYIDDGAFTKVKRYTISSDDVYISIAGTIGRVGIIPKDLSGANLTENAAKITNIQNDYDRFYLMYYLRSHFGQSDIASKIVGTSQPKLALFRIQELKVPKAPLLTQRKISEVLSAYDDLIENNLQRIKILEEMAQNLYREWFIKFRFPGHQHARFTDSPLGRIPEGWLCLFSDLVNFKEGPGLRKWQYRPEGLPFLNIRTLVDNDIDLSKVQYLDPKEVEVKYQHFLLKEYDHVVSSSGTLGRIVTIQKQHLPLMLNTSIIRMRSSTIRVGRWQLKHFLISDYFQHQILSFAIGAAQPNFGPSHLQQMLIISPSDEIGKLYEETVEPLEEMIGTLVRKNTTLRRTRDLLLPRLISGEVDVSELDIAVPEEADA